MAVSNQCLQSTHSLDFLLRAPVGYTRGTEKAEVQVATSQLTIPQKVSEEKLKASLVADEIGHLVRVES